MIAAAFIPNIGEDYSNFPPSFRNEFNNKGITLNFGGKYIYSFHYDNAEKKISISRELNIDYVEDFWKNGKNQLGKSFISNISTIVGKNGTGKTSVLRMINSDNENFKCKFILIKEEEEEFKICTFSLDNKLYKIYFNGVNYDSFISNEFNIQYYSPVIDFELKNYSSISLVNKFEKSIDEYQVQIMNEILFFISSDVYNDVKNKYHDFPDIKRIKPNIPRLQRRHFNEFYSKGNFGNPNTGEVVINTIIDPFLYEGSPKFKQDDCKELVTKIKKGLQANSFYHLFSQLWAVYVDDTQQLFEIGESHLVPQGDDELMSLDILIFSYLLLGATFTYFEGHNNHTYEPKQIDYDTKDYVLKINSFIEYYISNISDKWHKELSNKELSMTVDNLPSLIEYIEANWNINGNFNKDSDEKVRNYLLSSLKFIIQLQELRTTFIEVQEKSTLDDTTYNNVVKKLINQYGLILSTTASPRTPQLISFEMDRKLSTGEKSLIIFYASINYYILENLEKEKSYDDILVFKRELLLLLDEPELGYHPAWKKKFIDAISATLPSLFKNIYVENNKIVNYPIQVIFTTHDPLTLSDMPKDKVIYLNKNGDKSFVDAEKEINTFAANVHDLYNDSFYLENGTMGAFAESKIKELIHFYHRVSLLDFELDLEKKKEEEKNLLKEYEDKRDVFEFLVNNVGEPVYRNILENNLKVIKSKLNVQ